MEINTGTLTFDQYQDLSLSSDQKIKSDLSLDFPLLGLFGETGSLLSELKKKQRDQTAYLGYEKSVLEELGDVLWYFSALASRARIKLSYLAHNLDQDLAEWDFSTPVDLKFIDKQNNRQTKHAVPSKQFEEKLLQLAGEVGLLVTDHQAGRLRGNQPALAGRLVAILRTMRDAAQEAGISLADAAIVNLRKTNDRWPRSKQYPPLLDAAFPEHEQIPRLLTVKLVEVGEPGKRQVEPYYEDRLLGDKLTDNRIEDDDYRFHDAFHMAFAAKLGWSPNLRRLLKRKRKSKPNIDEVEDGARAVLIEEGVSTWIFNHAQRLKLFEGATSLDYGLLKTVREFVEGYEVAIMPLWLWEEAILAGYDIFRKLQQHRGGFVEADLENRSICFRTDPAFASPL